MSDQLDFGLFLLHKILSKKLTHNYHNNNKKLENFLKSLFFYFHLNLNMNILGHMYWTDWLTGTDCKIVWFTFTHGLKSTTTNFYFYFFYFTSTTSSSSPLYFLSFLLNCEWIDFIFIQFNSIHLTYIYIRLWYV